MLTGTIALLMTTATWWLAPSIGPAAHRAIDPVIEAGMGLVTNAEFGAMLQQLARDGLPVIAPGTIEGTIAFPSYHTVMALLAVVYLRGTALFVPALALNTAMVPAILSHGGHHLLDLLAGVLAFLLAAWLARRIVPDHATMTP